MLGFRLLFLGFGLVEHVIELTGLNDKEEAIGFGQALRYVRFLSTLEPAGTLRQRLGLGTYGVIGADPRPRQRSSLRCACEQGS